MATESQVMAAVLAVLNSGRSTADKVTEPSKVASPRPANHTTVTLVERQGGSGRAGRHVTRGWQVYIFSASATAEANVRNSLDKADSALANKVLVVGSERSTPIAVGPSRPVGPDDGWLSGNKSYLFTI